MVENAREQTPDVDDTERIDITFLEWPRINRKQSRDGNVDIWQALEDTG